MISPEKNSKIPDDGWRLRVAFELRVIGRHRPPSPLNMTDPLNLWQLADTCHYCDEPRRSPPGSARIGSESVEMGRLKKLIPGSAYAGSQMSRDSRLPAIVWNLNGLILFGFLFAHVLADQCACAKLKDCVSCIIGRNPQDYYDNPQDPTPYPLQVMQKPVVILDATSPDRKAYSTLSFPNNDCSITCFWNKQSNSCADFQIANIASFKTNPDLVAPTLLDVDIFAALQFDLYTRFDNSRRCQDASRKLLFLQPANQSLYCT